MNRVVVDTDVVSFLFKNHSIGNRISGARGAHSPHLVNDRRRAGTLGDSARLERSSAAFGRQADDRTTTLNCHLRFGKKSRAHHGRRVLDANFRSFITRVGKR